MKFFGITILKVVFYLEPSYQSRRCKGILITYQQLMYQHFLAVQQSVFHLVFAGPVHRTEKNPRTELNWTMDRSIFRLRLPEFGAIPVAGCQVSEIF